LRSGPLYLPEELDQECEAAVGDFLHRKRGTVMFPVATDDLACMLESEAKDLDLYADLSAEDGEVEGVTEFRQGEKPTVKISSRLTQAGNLENRLRTTLTHEFGHVHFHNQMFQVETKPPSLFHELFVEQEPIQVHANRCKRETVVSLDKRDWMEWQAGFVCGAILMPITSLVATVREFRRANCLELSSISEKSSAGVELVAEVARAYQTSKDAARVRLLQRRMLSSGSFESLL
jgi:hypothetical protein